MSAFSSIDGFPVSALSGSAVATVPADADLTVLCRTLADADVGALVVGEVGAVRGVVSERDVVRAIASGALLSTTAGELASTPVVSCSVDATVTEAAAVMLEHAVRHVLLADADGYAGIVSARDLLGVYASAALSGDED
jgi:CBS domain-containing protein